MSTAVARTKVATLADMLHKLGDVPTSRIRFLPYPATEGELLAIQAHEDRLYELVDGLLVEKAMGYRESFLACVMIEFLRAFVRPRKLGIVTGPDGMLKLTAGLVRSPDVAFISWDRIPGKKFPKQPIPELAPDLAVEVLSKSNTPAEMKRKRRDYFKAGVLLVWIVDPKARTVAVYTSPTKAKTLTESQTLDGGDVLPGFKLLLSELFAELD